MTAAENLITMALDVSIDSTTDQLANDESMTDADRKASDALLARDVALHTLIERFGLGAVLEGVQFAAEQAADAHGEATDMRATTRRLRAVATSIATAVALVSS